MVILGKEDSNASDLDKDSNYSNRQEESDCDTTKDSVSSQGDFLTAEEQKLDEVRNTKQLKKNVSEARPKIYDRQTKSSQLKTANSSNINSKTSSKKSAKSNGKTSKLVTKKSPGHSNNITTALSDRKPLSVSSPSSESSEGVEDRPCDELKEIEREKDEEVRCLDQASNAAQAAANEDEANNGEADVGEHEDQEALNQKIEEMESKIDKLEEELREVAALEIALYSVVPEHGSSAHKVHSPARRLSRLYIHASKHWSPGRRATIAKNTVSGLVLVARSCGNDVPRLTFWLSNTVVLREIISQAFGKSRGANPFTKYVELNGGGKTSEGKSLKWKGVSGIKQLDKPVIVPFLDDWQDISTFATALEKVESWIFCRIVESIWWQTLAPNMQSPANDVASNKTLGKLLGPTLGDRQQGNFSIKLWKTAFQDAFQRLCPVRAGGHECGCLPVLARMVMEQCIARLDVAMFNAILRESAHEIPTDPISDPIVDPKVLPIPAGDLSFGSGAQLKNSIGNWSRWLTDSFGMDADDSLNEEQHDIEDDQRQSGENEPKSFILLNSLSDLLMLPKDMLIDCSIRKEVCPSIGLSLLKRILCNFTPDEFCPDSVPGAVLEAVNTESILEQRLSGESSSSFPCPASPVIYVPPSPADVSQKVAEAGWKPQQTRNASLVQKKGYTSDEELDELDSPLPSIIDKSPRSSAASPGNGNETQMKQSGYSGANARYELLREVWSA